jgi:PadR family transcriptional regulator PadR
MVNVRRDMVQGLVRLRILHAASARPISGVELTTDLAAVGHKISPGTLYPLLHKMEKAGWIRSTGRTVKGKRRRYYRLTKKGEVQLNAALAEVQQFLRGILEVQPGLCIEFTAATQTEPILPQPAWADRNGDVPR